MITMAEALQKRLDASNNNKLAEHIVMERKEYNKKWAYAVDQFKIAINSEREGQSNVLQLPWIAVQQKLIHVKEISDLRWFYAQCVAYSKKKKENTFAKCFFGALKIK